MLGSEVPEKPELTLTSSETAGFVKEVTNKKIQSADISDASNAFLNEDLRGVSVTTQMGLCGRLLRVDLLYAI